MLFSACKIWFCKGSEKTALSWVFCAAPWLLLLLFRRVAHVVASSAGERGWFLFLCQEGAMVLLLAEEVAIFVQMLLPSWAPETTESSPASPIVFAMCLLSSGGWKCCGHFLLLLLSPEEDLSNCCSWFEQLWCCCWQRRLRLTPSWLPAGSAIFLLLFLLILLLAFCLPLLGLWAEDENLFCYCCCVVAVWVWFLKIEGPRCTASAQGAFIFSF